MKNFSELATTENNPKYLKDIYSLLAPKTGALDSLTPRVGSHSLSDIEEVREIQFGEVKANLVKDGVSFQSLDEAKRSAKILVQDGFINPMTGIGTMSDPGMYNSANVPIAMGPIDATSAYSSGGLPQLIIDKKAKSVLLNGYQFDSKHKFWDRDKLSRLKEYADSTDFTSKLVDTIRDGYIFGGACLYPSFKRDDVNSFRSSLKQLIRQKVLTKDCISHWVSVDRWNTVVIPEYNISLQDYLFAKTYYIPIAGIAVNTDRTAVLRPKQLPYWGAIRQLGWGVSDYEGYIRSILGYEMLIMSVPIMAQQMSLLLHELPLDGILAQNGLDAAREFMQENDAQLRKWSMLNPTTINSFGKVYAVDRSYAGYEELGLMLRQDIGAQSGLPESVLFHTQPKGFSNNTEEVLLKQSETIRMAGNSLLPMLRPSIEVMAISCFGPEQDILDHLQYIQLSFETPVVATETERSEASARYAASLSSLVTSGVPIKEAIELLKQFYREVEISTEFMTAVAEREERNRQEKLQEHADKLAATEKKHTDEVMNLKNNATEKSRMQNE